MSPPDGQLCPVHSHEFIQPAFVGSETAEYTFTCTRTDHRPEGAYTWPFISEPPAAVGDGMDLGLAVELPAAVATATLEAGVTWVEYGLVERAYALAQPADWAKILARYDHTHYHPADVTKTQLPYTASKYLARSLGGLGGAGELIHHVGPGTGRWSYNSKISYWALPPGADWDSRQTWEASGVQMDSYMPPARPS